MKYCVGIDGFNLALSTGTGIATYSRTLAKTVQSLDLTILGLFDIDTGNRSELRELMFFDRIEHPPRRVPWAARWRTRLGVLPPVVEVPLRHTDQRPILDRLPRFDRIASGAALFQSGFRHFQRHGRLATIHMSNPPEIMHWTYPLPLRIEGSRNIYTIHDLVPFKMPYMTLDNKRLVHDITRACIDTADLICTVSAATADEVCTLFPAAREKTTTTFQTYDLDGDILPPDTDSRALVSRMGLEPDGYFLFYGAIEPKKNVARLLEAHATLSGNTPLVIVTGRSWNNQTESTLLERVAGQHGRVILLEYLPRSILQSLIRHARAVTFPSLHEGFGLPILEAMRLGAPVLTSPSGALTEVAGGACLMVDPYDVAAIRSGLEQLDGSTALRRSLAAKGLDRASVFSPERYAQTMHNIYQRLLMDRQKTGRQA